jgi:3',5'-cyclic AMP phosphodiesterase CpdA
VAIDTYPEGKSGNKGRVDISDESFAWLEKDLAATRQRVIFVMGHPPIQVQPDMDTGRMRHRGESVSPDPARVARFVELLKKYRVRAYLCGHTHNASVVKVQGVWQADSGHTRGAGDPGSPSTFLKIRVNGEQTWVDIYRADPAGTEYTLRTTVLLD